jgi:hypothetical protein
MRRHWIAGILTVAILVLGVGYLIHAQTVEYVPRAVFTVGDLVCADSTSSLARLAAVAAGQVPISQGVGVCPAYSATLPTGLAGQEDPGGQDDCGSSGDTSRVHGRLLPHVGGSDVWWSGHGGTFPRGEIT